MIRVDAVWLAVEPLDTRAGTEAARRRVVTVFGAARPHHAYLFANRRANDGDLPIDNNWVENCIRPIALGRQNWLFASSLRAGKRAAAVMSLVHSARFNGLDPYVYLREVLERLPTLAASRSEDLLPHRWAQ